MACDRMCSPRAAKGLNMINLAMWNKVVINKTCWELANKKDKLWIRWIHSYYIKEQEFMYMGVAKQACWMVRKVFEARDRLHLISNLSQVTVIKQVYM